MKLYVWRRLGIRYALTEMGITESCGFLRFENRMAMASDELVNALADEDRNGPLAYDRELEMFHEHTPKAYDLLNGMAPTPWIPIDRWEEFAYQ